MNFLKFSCKLLIVLHNIQDIIMQSNGFFAVSTSPASFSSNRFGSYLIRNQTSKSVFPCLVRCYRDSKCNSVLFLNDLCRFYSLRIILTENSAKLYYKKSGKITLRNLIGGLNVILCLNFIEMSGELVRSFTIHGSNAVTDMILLGKNQVISAGCDNNIQIWDSTTGIVIRTLRNHTSCVRDILLFSNQTLLSGSDDSFINIWNITTGLAIQRIRANFPVICLEMLRNGYLASGSRNGTVDIWDLNQTSLVYSFIANSHPEDVRSLKVLPDGNLAVGGRGSFTVKIWNTTSWTLIKSLVGHTSVLRFSLVPYKKNLISSSSDLTIKVWDLSTGATIVTLKGHDGLIHKTELFKNIYLASGSDDRTINIWDLETFELRLTLSGFASATIANLYLGDDLLLIGTSTNLEIWKLSNLK